MEPTPVRIHPSGEYPSGVGLSNDPVAGYSRELVAANRTEELIPQFVRGRGILVSAFLAAALPSPALEATIARLPLSAPAWSSMTAKLASNNAAVSVPATLVIPANATSVGFTANVQSVTSPQTVTLRASMNGASKSFVLRLNAAASDGTDLIGQPEQCGVRQCGIEHGNDPTRDVKLHGDGAGDHQLGQTEWHRLRDVGSSIPGHLEPELGGDTGGTV